MSLSEPFQKPTTMLYRNLLAMETEELLRSYPIDGAVLMGGCDKTTPGLVMGAESMDLPALFMPAGPMSRGNWGGKTLGSGSDTWKYWADLRAGVITPAGLAGDRERDRPVAWALHDDGDGVHHDERGGGAGCHPARGSVHPGRGLTARGDGGQTGRRIVDMVWEDVKLSRILTRTAFLNSITTVLAIGGSTNAIIHLIAMARRIGVKLGLEDFEDLGAVPRCWPTSVPPARI